MAVSINYRRRGLCLCDITQTRIWEWLDLKKGILFIEIKKSHWVDFYHYRVVVYTHCQHTFMFKQHAKVSFASDDPFNTPDSDDQLVRRELHAWTVFRLTWSLQSVQCSLLPEQGKSIEVYFTLEHSFTDLHYAAACSVFTHRWNLLEKCELWQIYIPL